MSLLQRMSSEILFTEGWQMIKLVISDFDGVLMDCKDIHYQSFNFALGEYGLPPISLEEHFNKYDGRSSRVKLEMLGVEDGYRAGILEIKQKKTLELLQKLDNINWNIKNSIERCPVKFVVASNAVMETVEIGVEKLGISYLVDKIYSNANTKYHKPNCSLYLRVMSDYGVHPGEVLIIEDSRMGREAASLSGAYVYGVDSSWQFPDLGDQFIKNFPDEKVEWTGHADLNVLVPCAGKGLRFNQAGYELPKPMIDVGGYPMIYRVVESLGIKANYTFLIQKEHQDKYRFGDYLKLMVRGCNVVLVDGVTEGAACTSLLVKHLINDDKKLLICNSDQIMDWDSCHFMSWNINWDVDGSLVTFKCEDGSKKWSYCQVDEQGNVIEVKEKEVISEIANCGIFYFKHGNEYVKYCERMIDKGIKVNGEYYIAPVFNEMIIDQLNIKNYNIDPNSFRPIGTPADLDKYLNK